MKIVVFGPFKRTGALHGESVVDLSRAYAKYLQERTVEPNPLEMADVVVKGVHPRKSRYFRPLEDSGAAPGGNTGGNERVRLNTARNLRACCAGREAKCPHDPPKGRQGSRISRPPPGGHPHCRDLCIALIPSTIAAGRLARHVLREGHTENPLREQPPKAAVCLAHA
jgi:hypothetical protein